jgi:hypothetical protein
MHRISSGMTFFYKRVFPIIWFCFIALLVASAFVAPAIGGTINGSPLMFLAFGAFMVIVGYFMMKKFVFGLADEVFNAGDALVTRKGNREERLGSPTPST